MANSSNSKHSLSRFSFWTVLFIMALTLAGCQTANYGKFRLDREVEKIFTSAQVLPDHIYYYSGPNTRPDAVMGIHQNYFLDDEYWNKADNIHSDIKFWVDQINKSLSANGYTIWAPDGNRIGIYYSRFNTGPVRMEENNTVIVYLPEKETDTWTRIPGRE